MRHRPISPALFKRNRENLRALLPQNSIAIFNANDILPTNADGTLTLQPNSDLFYLTGVEQEESILVLVPNAFDEQLREILFLRQPNDHLKIWEGHKLDKEQATSLSGIQTIRWTSDFPTVLHQLMCESDEVFLNTNEHARAQIEAETRDARFVNDCKRRYPLHRYNRVAPLMGQLRLVKSEEEIALLKEACSITRAGFLRALKRITPGAHEFDVEAELAREFIRRRGKFAYNPIIASGANSCVLHYNQNDQPLKKGDVLLMDVASSYANYNSDLTRTVPIGGKFSRRQKQVYRSVLKVMRHMIQKAVPGTLHKDWQKEAETIMQEELLELGLLKPSEIKKQKPTQPALKKYFMHGLGHPLGLDVHDLGSKKQPFAPGWVLTVEPGIYIPEEGFGIRLENCIQLTEGAPVDLMQDIPVEPEEIEDLMGR